MEHRKNKFRQRKLDFKRPLPIKRWTEIRDIDEEALNHRPTFDVNTGVEKEEEEVKKNIFM